MKFVQLLIAGFILLLLMPLDLTAQRQFEYEELRQREFFPPAFMTVFPGVSVPATTSNVTAVFKIRHNRLDFRSVRSSERRNEEERFATELRVDFAVYRRGADGERTGSPVHRESRQQRATATDYDHTRSRFRFVEASQAFQVDPGSYVMRAEVYSNNSRIGTFTRNFEVKESFSDYSWVMLTQKPEDRDRPRLINMANNAHYGQELTTFAVVPEADSDYRVRIDRLRVRNQDTTQVQQVFDEQIASDDLLTGRKVSVVTEDNTPLLDISGEGPANLIRLELPNKTYQNRHYRMRIYRPEGAGEEKITDYTWYNLWVDMPVSLLNVDFAIRKLRHIADEETMRDLRRGSRQEREEKFLDFWKERDPEPETSYNSLMSEYYQRVDEAYQRYSTPGTAGFNTDQGKIYITNGEPLETDRRYPSGSPTREIWVYEDRIYIFEATSGFGDYRLVDERSRS